MSKMCEKIWTMQRLCYLMFRLLFLLEGGVWSLNNVTISVPKAVLSGGDAALRCSYDLQGAALYSIRWYRAQTEFYRYVPRELPPTRVFPLPGATVDLGASDDHQVRLRGLHRQLSGEYQCEVSADAPLFHTDIQSALLTVVDPPLVKPFLTVDRLSYTRGDVIRANCSVSPSYPPANITWYVDSKEITNVTGSHNPPEPDLWEAQSSFGSLELTLLEMEAYKMGITFTSSSLGNTREYYRYKQEQKDLTDGNQRVSRHSLVAPPSGQFALSCRATIHDVYCDSSDMVVLKEDSPRPASVTGEDSSGAVTVSSFLLLLLCLSGSTRADILRFL